ncbi:homeodomain transcription factor ste12 [Phlyctochytrium bullatum]|nr:homeodomain transcription factor ste12 [Phlyctochytrium bullatum]
MDSYNPSAQVLPTPPMMMPAAATFMPQPAASDLTMHAPQQQTEMSTPAPSSQNVSPNIQPTNIVDSYPANASRRPSFSSYAPTTTTATTTTTTTTTAPPADQLPLQGLSFQPQPPPMPASDIAPLPTFSEPAAGESFVASLEALRVFLGTAPSNWNPDQDIKRFPLPSGEQLSCILWKNLFYITGTDIVRSLVFRFSVFGRPVKNLKKFEEGVFSDLRSLKPGIDATLEEPRSEFLEFLFRAACIRTQKKQKVFFWFSVPHDRLFMDALERDLKRESLGIEPTTIPLTPMPLNATLELAKQHCILPGFGIDSHQVLPAPLPYPTPSPFSTPAPPALTMPTGLAERHVGGIDRRMSFPGYATKPEEFVVSALSVTPQPPVLEQPDLAAVAAPLPAADGPAPLITPRRRAYSFADTAPYTTVLNSAAALQSDPNGAFHCTFDTCHRRFRRFETLRRHMRCHTGDKPYVCPYEGCSKGYSRADTLNRHVKCHHQGQTALKQSPSPTPSELPMLSHSQPNSHMGTPQPEFRPAPALAVFPEPSAAMHHPNPADSLFHPSPPPAAPAPAPAPQFHHHHHPTPPQAHLQDPVKPALPQQLPDLDSFRGFPATTKLYTPFGTVPPPALGDHQQSQPQPPVWQHQPGGMVGGAPVAGGFNFPPLAIPNGSAPPPPPSVQGGNEGPFTLPPLTPVISSFFSQYQPASGMPVF